MSDGIPVIRVVDDDEAFRTAISRLLRAAGWEIREYASAGDYLLANDDARPGCVLLDLRMPGPNGLDLQAALRKRDDALPIVFLTGHGTVPATVRAIKDGAEDFLTKPVKREVLIDAVRRALSRDAERRAAGEDLRQLRARYDGLTSRERTVMELVVAGRLNKQIASAIGASERTVKAHRARVMVKMGASSLAELIRSADRVSHERAPASV
jgi:FixJ family two-component response regulator